MKNFDHRSILVDSGGIVQCTWNTIVVFLYMLAAVTLLNISLLLCFFCTKISGLLSRICGGGPTHAV